MGRKSQLAQTFVAALSTGMRIAEMSGTASLTEALFRYSPGGTTMRWKISRHGHDPRQVDLLAAIALVIVIVAAYRYFEGHPEPPSTSAFIVPSQSTHW
jgi:hypothetical protein